MHEFTVGSAVGTDTGVDLRDPQFPDVSFLLSSITVRILQSFLNTSHGQTKIVFGSTTVAFGEFQDLSDLVASYHLEVRCQWLLET